MGFEEKECTHSGDLFIFVPQGLKLVFVCEPLSVSRVWKQGWFDILKLLHLLVGKRVLRSRSPWLLRRRVRPDLDGVNRVGGGRRLIHVGRLGGGCLWLLGSQAITFRVCCRRRVVQWGEFHLFHLNHLTRKGRNAEYGQPYLGDHVESHYLRSVNVEHLRSGHHTLRIHFSLFFRCYILNFHRIN